MQSQKIRNTLHNNTHNPQFLKHFSLKLRNETDFKNVWIHLVNAKGISSTRSWSDKYDDDTSYRAEVRRMIAEPAIINTIIVDHYDMTFRAMVPIFDDSADFIGFLEVITHFNSIAKKIKDKGFEPVILVNKEGSKQIKYPFTQKFSGGHYIANTNANRELSSYIDRKGLDYFISLHNHFIIDKETESIVINYVIVDTDQKPMANFLMFKSLKEFELESSENIKTRVGLFMLLCILCAGFFLYIFSIKGQVPRYAQKRNYTGTFVGLFLFVSGGYYLLVQWNFQAIRENYLETHSQNFAKDYQIIYRNLNTLSETLFNKFINKPQVTELITKAYTNEKAEARKNLYQLLVNEYEFFQQYGLRQLHFHLKNNESFLRFHRPDKFGDNLTGVRATVEWVNENQSKIDGFEEGRIFNDFRFLFPLMTRNEAGVGEHIGSVEVSFSAYAFASDYAFSHKTKAGFLISADAVDTKVFKEEQSNYSNSNFSGFYHENAIKKLFEQDVSHVDVSLLDQSQLRFIEENIAKGEVFTVSSKKASELFTFLPIRNPLSKKIVAVLILQLDDMVLSNQLNHFLITLFSGFIAILFIVLYIYREFIARRKFQALSLKAQQIIDTQDSLIVIIQGNYILESNKKFLEFFNCVTLDDFKKEHQCICDRFIKDDNYFHMGKVPGAKNWVQVLELLPDKEHIVAINDVNNSTHSFAVNLSHFENNYIVSFTDISDTMTEHFSLEERASHDNLTGAYNRDYFENNIKLLIAKAHRKGQRLGIIMFDIDFFKQVNDTYGHSRGDSVLKQLVQTVKKSIRQDEVIIRWGGEEFILTVAIESSRALQRMAEHIRSRVAHDYFEEVGQITCSFGLTFYKKGDYVGETIERADSALYEAKHSGRNQVIVNEK